MNGVPAFLDPTEKLKCELIATAIAILNELWKNGEEEIKAKTWKN